MFSQSAALRPLKLFNNVEQSRNFYWERRWEIIFTFLSSNVIVLLYVKVLGKSDVNIWNIVKGRIFKNIKNTTANIQENILQEIALLALSDQM